MIGRILCALGAHDFQKIQTSNLCLISNYRPSMREVAGIEAFFICDRPGCEAKHYKRTFYSNSKRNRWMRAS